ncbi:hypothetical protein TB1_016277 [Malus domestica]
MALVIACGESSPSHIALLSCLNRTLDSIKHNIARIFVYILCCQANNARGKDLLPITFEDFMKKWDENYHLSAQRWFKEEEFRRIKFTILFDNQGTSAQGLIHILYVIFHYMLLLTM